MPVNIVFDSFDPDNETSFILQSLNEQLYISAFINKRRSILQPSKTQFLKVTSCISPLAKEHSEKTQLTN